MGPCRCRCVSCRRRSPPRRTRPAARQTQRRRLQPPRRFHRGRCQDRQGPAGARTSTSLRHPASITKVMTPLSAVRAARARPCRASIPLSRCPPTRRARRRPSSASPRLDHRGRGRHQGHGDNSANDVAVVVAENIAGSEDAFATMMTRKARELGMSSTAFYNPHGLPNEPPNRSRPLAILPILGRAIQDRFPKYYRLLPDPLFQYGSRTIRNHNRLLGRVEGVDGIKTGYTRALRLQSSDQRQDRHPQHRRRGARRPLGRLARPERWRR